MFKTKKPLYQKVNPTAHGVYHHIGGNFSEARNQTNSIDAPMSQSLRKGARRGLGDTPLFRFLLSRVGRHWNGTFSVAVGRFDQNATTFWLVALREEDAQDYVRLSSY